MASRRRRREIYYVSLAGSHLARSPRDRAATIIEPPTRDQAPPGLGRQPGNSMGFGMEWSFQLRYTPATADWRAGGPRASGRASTRLCRRSRHHLCHRFRRQRDLPFDPPASAGPAIPAAATTNVRQSWAAGLGLSPESGWTDHGGADRPAASALPTAAFSPDAGAGPLPMRRLPRARAWPATAGRADPLRIVGPGRLAAGLIYSRRCCVRGANPRWTEALLDSPRRSEAAVPAPRGSVA